MSYMCRYVFTKSELQALFPSIFESRGIDVSQHLVDENNRRARLLELSTEEVHACKAVLSQHLAQNRKWWHLTALTIMTSTRLS